MKKTIILSATLLSLFALAACSNSKASDNQTRKESSSISSKKKKNLELLAQKFHQALKLQIVKPQLLNL